MREMALYYAASNIALLGGSFAPLGGHNLIEAAACGCPLVMGPHTFNFTQATNDAITEGAALRVSDPAALARGLKDLFSDKPRRLAMSAAASAFAAKHRGATQRTVAVLGALLRTQTEEQ